MTLAAGVETRSSRNQNFVLMCTTYLCKIIKLLSQFFGTKLGFSHCHVLGSNGMGFKFTCKSAFIRFSKVHNTVSMLYVQKTSFWASYSKVFVHFPQLASSCHILRKSNISFQHISRTCIFETIPNEAMKTHGSILDMVTSKLAWWVI